MEKSYPYLALRRFRRLEVIVQRKELAFFFVEELVDMLYCQAGLFQELACLDVKVSFCDVLLFRCLLVLPFLLRFIAGGLLLLGVFQHTGALGRSCCR